MAIVKIKKDEATIPFFTTIGAVSGLETRLNNILSSLNALDGGASSIGTITSPPIFKILDDSNFEVTVESVLGLSEILGSITERVAALN